MCIIEIFGKQNTIIRIFKFTFFYLISRRTPRFEESEDSVTEPLISNNKEMHTTLKAETCFSFFSSKKNIYSCYVLLLFLITYLLNQLDRYMLAIVTKPLAQVNSFAIHNFP